MIQARNLAIPLALAAVLAAGLAVRIVFWYGLVNVDPYAYADAAASVARWQPVFDPDLVGNLYYTQYLRLTLVLPAALGYLGWGSGEVQSIAFPVACSLGTGLVTFWLVVHISSDRIAGVLGCLLTVVFPEIVINSTQFLPDTVMTFFSALTIMFFWLGLEARSGPWRRRTLLFALTGVAWALAFYSRQTAVGLALPLLGLVVYYRRFDWAWLGGVAGAGVIGLGMSVLLVSLGGEPFEDIRTVIGEGRGSQPGALGYTDLDLSYSRMFAGDAKFVPLTGLAVFGLAIVAVTWRDYGRVERRRLVALAIIAVGLFLYFEFLMRLPSLYSWWKEPRYVLTLIVPLSALAGIGLARWVRMLQGPPRAGAMAYAGALVVFALAFNWDSIRADHEYWEANRIDAVARDLAAALEDRPEEEVFLWNDDMFRYLAFHVGLERTTHYDQVNGRGYLQPRFTPEGSSRVTPGGLVVTSPGQEVWPHPTTPASHWRHVWTGADGTSVWAVPSEPMHVAMQAVAAQVDGPEVTRFGMSETEVLPQQHVLMSFGVQDPSVPWGLTIGARCGETITSLGHLEAAAGQAVVTRDIAMDLPGSHESQSCDVVVSGDSGEWTTVGSVTVAGVVFLEPEAAFSHDAATERSKGNAWYRHDRPDYSNGGAAVALFPFEPLYLRVPALEGDFWIDVGVFNYGESALNTISLEVGAARTDVTWGGSVVGVEHKAVRISGVQPADFLKVTIVGMGQSGLVIDSITFTTIAPPEGPR